MSAYYLALAGLSLFLLGLSAPILRRAWAAHRTIDDPNTEHGLVVASSLTIICAALTTTAVGQATQALALLSGGSAVIRAVLLTLVLYLYLRHPEPR